MGVMKEAASRDFPAPPESDSSKLFSLLLDSNRFLPLLQKGSAVYYNRTPSNPEDCIGLPAVIQISGGNPVFAILLRGSEKGLFDIATHGKDLRIDWVSPVEFYKV